MNPIVLKLEIVSRKRYNYCKSKEQWDKEHIEDNCWTKARDKKKTVIKTVKKVEIEENFSNDEKIRIRVVKVKLRCTETKEYWFNIEIIYYTTNERNCFRDI